MQAYQLGPEEPPQYALEGSIAIGRELAAGPHGPHRQRGWQRGRCQLSGGHRRSVGPSFAWLSFCVKLAHSMACTRLHLQG